MHTQVRSKKRKRWWSPVLLELVVCRPARQIGTKKQRAKVRNLLDLYSNESMTHYRLPWLFFIFMGRDVEDVEGDGLLLLYA